MKRIDFLLIQIIIFGLIIIPLVVLQISSCTATGNRNANTSKSVNEQISNNWLFDKPENRGVDSEMLKRLHEALDSVAINSVVIVKDGYIIDEYYADGFNENYVFRMASVTKSVTGALVGLAIELGYINSVDVKLVDFFPQLTRPDQVNKRDITIKHLLTHTSGIFWNEWAGGDYIRRLFNSENWVDFILNQRMASQPGIIFNYTTGGSHLLGVVIEKATGVSAHEFALEHLFKPVGMDSVMWRTDPQGHTDAGNGIHMTTRDAARFGQLYLDGGRWNGRQIIPEDWINVSTKRQAGGPGGPASDHGYQWWIRSFNGHQGFYAMGHGGQFIFVVPALSLVTVMTSRVSELRLPQRYFIEYIIPAFN